VDDLDPYAPPVAPVLRDPAGTAGAVEEHGVFPPVLGAVLSAAWGRLRERFWTVVLGFAALWMVGFGLGLPFNLLQAGLQAGAGEVEEPALSAAMLLLSVASALIGTVVKAVLQGWIVLGSTRAMLRFAREQPVAVGDFFVRPGQREWRLIGSAAIAQFVFGVALMVGLCAALVPALVVVSGLMFWAPVMIDQDVGPMEALRRSWELGHGLRVDLAVFVLVMLLGLGLGSLLSLGLGFFPLSALFSLGIVQIYLGLRNHQAQLA
jgi:hypothetical protein